MLVGGLIELIGTSLVIMVMMRGRRCRIQAGLCWPGWLWRLLLPSSFGRSRAHFARRRLDPVNNPLMMPASVWNEAGARTARCNPLTLSNHPFCCCSLSHIKISQFSCNGFQRFKVIGVIDGSLDRFSFELLSQTQIHSSTRK